MADTENERREAIRLEDYLKVLKDRAWIIILAILCVFLVALFVSLKTTPLYSASAELVYDKASLSTAVFGYDVLGYDYDRPRTIETAIAAISRYKSIAEGVKANLDSQGSPSAQRSVGELSGMVSASAASDTDLVTISVVSTDPNEAAAVANAFVDEFIVYRQGLAKATVSGARDIVEKRLDSLSLLQRESESGLQLQDKVDQLLILEAAQDGDFQKLREASVPGAPFTPRTNRNIVLAIVVGLVLGVGLAFLLEYLDKRVKDEKTLEQVSGLPVLTSVPAVGKGWKRVRRGRRSNEAVGFTGGGPALLESFRTLRSTLQYFDVDGTLHTILVTSGVPEEGKTITTINLGISLALSGKRVIVLEADLRRPMVHEYLGLDNETGLSSILAGRSSVPGALQVVDLDALIPERARRDQGDSAPPGLRKNLHCVTSGPLPPNPAELLQSARMSHVISELKHMGDYLLIDTPPVLPVSDALTLASHADAVILTARLRSSTRDQIAQVRELLKRAGVHVIGVVAEGAKPRRGYYYKRGYHYGGYSYQ
jgi:Mrp family chromosome partitioning ATPase/capsular polysaccharide biosynthesis protein